jgi:hypothetical protein
MRTAKGRVANGHRHGVVAMRGSSGGGGKRKGSPMTTPAAKP